MRPAIPIFYALAVALLAAGCNRSNDSAVAQAKAELEVAKTELAKVTARAEAAEAELAKFRATSAAKEKSQEADRLAAEWVLRVGGTVRVFDNGVRSEYPKDGKLPDGPFQVTLVDLNKPAEAGKLSNEGLAYLSGLKHLKELHMNNTNTVSDFRFLEGMSSLEVFHGMLKNDDLSHFKTPERIRDLLVGNFWGNPSFTDAGVSRLKPFKNLERLDLNGCQITNGSLADLGEHPKLVLVSLYGTPISDDGLRHLAIFPELREINLERAPVGGPGLVHLKGLSKLETLVLAATKVDDAGLIHLKSLSQPLNVRFHYLQGVTDAGLVHLKSMSNLRSLQFPGTKVTDAGIADLKKSLPNCQITK